MNVTRPLHPLVRPFSEFFRREAAGGIVLMVSCVLALLLANLDWGPARYFPAIWETHLSISINEIVLDYSLIHWINDGLMAIFFLIVGLEIKREVMEGELSSLQQAAIPIAGALGGMLVPAVLFWVLNMGTPTANAWGIPMATDIAFALAVLQLLGPRVPTALKVFLTALAIVDDLGVVLVIAGFYTEKLYLNYLWMALGIWAGLLVLNWLGVRNLVVYLLLGVVLWYFMLMSGIHATLAGVLLALAIPFKIRYTPPTLIKLLQERLQLIQADITPEAVDARVVSEELEDLADAVSSPAQKLEQRLHSVVALGIIPLFAFANTSLVIEPSALGQLLSPLSIGIFLGLVVGKPVGIGGMAWLATRLGLAQRPEGVTWRHIWGAGLLGGIGFTMSIFVTLLALGEHSTEDDVAKMAVLLASLVAGLSGYWLLRTAPMPPPSVP